MKYNELHDTLMKIFNKSLDVWLKNHKEEDKLIIAQQLFAIGGEIREMGSKMQELSRYQ